MVTMVVILMMIMEITVIHACLSVTPSLAGASRGEGKERPR